MLAPRALPSFPTRRSSDLRRILFPQAARGLPGGPGTRSAPVRGVPPVRGPGRGPRRASGSAEGARGRDRGPLPGAPAPAARLGVRVRRRAFLSARGAPGGPDPLAARCPGPDLGRGAPRRRVGAGVRLAPAGGCALMETPELSVVAPLHNEEGNVRALFSAIRDALEPLGRSFEVLLVNDGSTDR